MLCNDLDNRPVRDDVEYPAYFKPATDVKTVEFDQRFVNEDSLPAVKAREPAWHDSVKFRSRQYSLDERSLYIVILNDKFLVSLV